MLKWEFKTELHVPKIVLFLAFRSIFPIDGFLSIRCGTIFLYRTLIFPSVDFIVISERSDLGLNM